MLRVVKFIRSKSEKILSHFRRKDFFVIYYKNNFFEVIWLNKSCGHVADRPGINLAKVGQKNKILKFGNNKICSILHTVFFWYFMFGFKVLIFWGKRIDSGSICRISTAFCLFKSLHKTVFIVMRNYKEITLLKVILKIFTFRPYEFENLAGLRGGQKINGTYLDWWPGLQKVQFGEITGH